MLEKIKARFIEILIVLATVLVVVSIGYLSYQENSMCMEEMESEGTSYLSAIVQCVLTD